MRLRTLGSAAAAGIGGFLLVFVTVAELLLPSIEFSVLVAIPAGLVVGAGVAAFVLLGAGTAAGPQRRRVAGGLAAFGSIVLAGFLLLVLGDVLPVTLALIAAALLGLVAGIVAFLRWHPTVPPPP